MKRYKISDLEYLTPDQKEKLRPMFSNKGHEEFLDIGFEEKLKDLIQNKETVVFKARWFDTKMRTWSCETRLRKVAKKLGYKFDLVGETLVRFL